MTDDDARARSTKLAHQAGVGEFFRDNTATGVVTVFDSRRKVVATLAGEVDLARYRGPMSAALAPAR